MRNAIRRLVKVLTASLSVAIIREETLHELVASRNSLESLARWTSPEVPEKLRTHIIRESAKSRSQLQQDLLVCFIYPDKNSERFFVEFGATDGISLSNTFLLETSLNWTGILCEPAQVWHSKLKSNRQCIVDFSCVHPQSNLEVLFSQTDNPELSTISGYSDNDLHSTNRKKKTEYLVTTVSLDDLLKRHKAPREITYLSVDTEGSEFEILESFPFENWKISIISVEHNYTSSREKIDTLLKSKGFQNILPETSLFDGWYLNEDANRDFLQALK